MDPANERAWFNTMREILCDNYGLTGQQFYYVITLIGQERMRAIEEFIKEQDETKDLSDLDMPEIDDAPK